MKKLTFLTFLSGILFLRTMLVVAQSDTIVSDSIVKPWRSHAVFGLNGTQSSFVNWNAGGRNNISVLGFINASAEYNKRRMKWASEANLALGGLQFIGVGNGSEGLQKTDDRLEFGTNLGYNLYDHMFITLMNNFKTQFLDGFQYPNDSVVVSRFIAPAYYNFGLGMNYAPSEHFSLFMSPIAGKLTYVGDQALADAGAFGVDPAVYNSTGALISHGKNLRSEFGAYVKMKVNKDIAKNINLAASTELFSNYLDHPENIDVNADVLFTFKINSWFTASLNWTVKYDHDIRITDSEGNTGPRLQFKSVLGLGITYKLKNYDE